MTKEKINLTTIRNSLTKKFGKGMVLVDKELKALSHMPYGISSQSLAFDLLVGRPGFPAGRLVEIMGQEASAKSTVGYHILAECQRIGGRGILVESEEAFETDRLKRLGIEVDDLIILQPRYMEEAFAMMEQSITELRKVFSGPIAIVWDSVAATPVLAETENEFDEETMGAAARFLSKAMRKFIRTIASEKIVLVFMNQLKSNFDKYSGEKWVSYGGKAIKFHATLRFILSVRKADLVLENKELVGQWIQVRNVKNKISTPYRTGKFYLNFRNGIDQYKDVREVGIQLGVFKDTKAGRTYVKKIKKNVQKKHWRKFVKEQWGSVGKCREWLMGKAIKQDLLVPYN